MSHELDFDQIGRTCAHDLEQIKERLARARALDIRIGGLEQKRDQGTAAIEQLIGERIRQGGIQVVDDATWDRWVDLAGTMASIWFDLDHVFSCHEHYLGEKAQHDRKVENLAKRPSRVRVADGVESNIILEGLVRYAPNYSGMLADANRHFEEALEAIKDRNVVRYHAEIQLARAFGTREWNLAKMLEKGKLVADDSNGADTGSPVVALATSGCTGEPKSV